MENNSHPQPLHGMFTAVPPRYDTINHVITVGMDAHWRRLAAEACVEGNPRHILDLGCGTGDLTINIARLAGKGAEIIGLDYSEPMLEKARLKAAEAGVGDSIKFTLGEATHIPFPDGYFDCAGISFAFRNLTYKNPVCEAHLAEVLRALKAGGRYVIVESSQPGTRFIKACFRLFLRAYVRPVGTIISGEKAAYRYLAESAAHYYSPDEVKGLLKQAGFHDVSHRPLFFGAAGIHVATKS